MSLTDDLEQQRAALQMINGAPFNAEAPPAALTGDITPTELHYVRSNFALPAHDGTLQIGGAVEHQRRSRSTTCVRCRQSNGPSRSNVPATAASTMRPLPTGEPWGDFAVSTARWTGARLSEVLALARTGRRTASMFASPAPTAAPITSTRCSPTPTGVT